MKTRFFATNPKEIEFTMTITMKLAEWEELKELVKNQWPGWKFTNAIHSLICQARQSFYAAEENE